MISIDSGSLSEIQKKALEAAEQALKLSINPYSPYHVGAAIYNEKGKIVPGSIIVTAGETICAEREAAIAAHSMGERKFNGMVVIESSSEGKITDDITPPCGVCRQFLYELLDIDERENFEFLLIGSERNKVSVTTLRELLPFPFDPAQVAEK